MEYLLIICSRNFINPGFTSAFLRMFRHVQVETPRLKLSKSEKISQFPFINLVRFRTIKGINLLQNVWNVAFTWDFISGQMKYFHFSFSSTSCNCLHDTTRNETHCDHFDRNETSFRAIKCHQKTTRNEITGKKTFVRALISSKKKVIAFYWMDRFSQTTTQTKFHIISPTMKSNVKQFHLWDAQIFILGRFGFRFHVNNLSMNYALIWF